MASEESLQTSRSEIKSKCEEKNDEDQKEPQWKRATLKSKSSDLFDKIMSDVEVKMQERLKKQLEALAAAQNAEGPVDIPIEPIDAGIISFDDEEEEKKEELDPHKEQVRKRAQRAWALIKRYINEQAVQKKNQKSGMNWSFLKQTLSNMTNMERAREDLYKKYLYAADKREWTKGLSHVPEHVFNKGRKAQTTEQNVDTKKHPLNVASKKKEKGKS